MLNTQVVKKARNPPMPRCNIVLTFPSIVYDVIWESICVKEEMVFKREIVTYEPNCERDCEHNPKCRSVMIEGRFDISVPNVYKLLPDRRCYYLSVKRNDTKHLKADECDVPKKCPENRWCYFSHYERTDIP